MPSAGSRAIDRTALLGAFLRLHMATLTDERLAGLPLAEQTELNSSMDTLGDIARTYGLSRPAARIYQSALVIDERRVRLDPGNTEYRRDLSVSYSKLGDLARAEGRTTEARGLYQQGLDIARELTELDPGNTDYLSDLSWFRQRLAEVAATQGRDQQ